MSRRLLTPTAGVLAIIGVMVTLSGLAWTQGLAGSVTVLAAVTGPQLSWWLLLPLFVLVEATVLHVQVRREAQAVSLNEIPLVLALFLATPVQMLAAAVLGGIVVYLGRRQTPVKVAFNTALRLFGVSLALVVFHALAGQAPDLEPGAWIAALTAVTATGVIDGLVILTVVALFEGGLHGHDVARELLTTPPVTALVGTVGLTAVVMLHADPRNAILLLTLGSAVFAGYRTYASLHDRHVSLARLYDFGRAVNDAHQIHEVLTSVLTGARDLLKAEVAELFLLNPDADPPDGRRWVLTNDAPAVVEKATQVPAPSEPSEPGALATPGPGWTGVWPTVLAGHGPLLLPRKRADRSAGRPLNGTGYREAVIVPVLDEAGILGHLMVAERMGQVRTFHASDIPLLETVANQAGLALRNSRLVERLRREALHDVLTGLANRAKLREALTEAVTDITAGTSAGLAVLLLDLDGFKEVNDSLGHHNGDLLLTHVAAQLLHVTDPTRTHDPSTASNVTVARLGGDEFAVLLPGISSTEPGLAVAERIHAAIGVPITLEGVEVSVRASIGIAQALTPGTDPALLMRRADEAMYTAKNNGGGTHVHHGDQRPDHHGQTPLALLAELRKAIETREITIHVQPQAHASTGMVYGAEALVRWNHPTLGLLPPAEFLTLADRHALMHDLTVAVLDQAVQAAAGWKSNGLDLTISVNLSARSLNDPDLLPTVEATLRRHRLPPSHLTLEITEDCVIDDPDRAIALLEALRATGVRLSVDDFGTGYSSLSYLRRLPVDEVKIDRSFITTLTSDPDSQVIVRAITDLGTNLGLHVIAEGVEDQTSWDHLTSLGCHAIQGYHLAKPMAPDHLAPWLHGYQTRQPHAVRPTTASATAPRPRLHVI